MHLHISTQPFVQVILTLPSATNPWKRQSGHHRSPWRSCPDSTRWGPSRTAAECSPRLQPLCGTTCDHCPAKRRADVHTTVNAMNEATAFHFFPPFYTVSSYEWQAACSSDWELWPRTRHTSASCQKFSLSFPYASHKAACFYRATKKIAGKKLLQECSYIVPGSSC